MQLYFRKEVPASHTGRGFGHSHSHFFSLRTFPLRTQRSFTFFTHSHLQVESFQIWLEVALQVSWFRHWHWHDESFQTWSNRQVSWLRHSHWHVRSFQVWEGEQWLPFNLHLHSQFEISYSCILASQSDCLSVQLHWQAVWSNILRVTNLASWTSYTLTLISSCFVTVQFILSELQNPMHRWSLVWDGIGFFTWSLLTSTTVRNGWQCTRIWFPSLIPCFPEKVIRHKASNKHCIRIGTSPYLKFGPEYLLLTLSPHVGWFFQERNCKGKPTQIAICVASLWYLQLWEFRIESPLQFNHTKNPCKFWMLRWAVLNRRSQWSTVSCQTFQNLTVSRGKG